MKKTLIEEIKAAEKTAHNSVARAIQNRNSALVRAQKQGQQDLEAAEDSLSSFKEEIFRETDEKIGQMKVREQKDFSAKLKKLENINSEKIDKGADIAFKKLVSESLHEPQ